MTTQINFYCEQNKIPVNLFDKSENLKDLLHEFLQTALEIELATIPAYLYGVYTIKKESADNGEAAKIIYSVFIQEMIHLTLVANIMNSVGLTPKLTGKSIITPYPKSFPHTTCKPKINLQTFSKCAICGFLEIEKPEKPESIPELTDYKTIGQFYKALEFLLIVATAKYGTSLFCGNESYQVKNKSTIAVTDLCTSLCALKQITDEGEGIDYSLWQTQSHQKLAHYYAFNQINEQQLYNKTDTTETGPTGASIEIDYESSYPVATSPIQIRFNEAATKLNDQFNGKYSQLLKTLETAFNGSPDLIPHAIGQMHELQSAFMYMIQSEIPYNDQTQPNTICGPTFEWVEE